jgi:hypothetical protein
MRPRSYKLYGRKVYHFAQPCKPHAVRFALRITFGADLGAMDIRDKAIARNMLCETLHFSTPD